MKRPPLFIWREVPIDVDEEMYQCVIRNWGNQVYVISANELPFERRKVGVKQEIKTLLFRDQDFYFFKGLIDSNPGAIHLFAGMCGETWKYAAYCYKTGEKNIATLGERPNRQFSLAKRMASFSLNYLRQLRYRNMVQVRIQMGKAGVDSAKRLGWPDEKLYPFMYCPNSQVKVTHTEANEIRFLYLGRFSKKYKGVDLLLEAAQQLDASGWSLDFIGGYGDDVDYVFKQAESNNNIRVKGTWKQEEIVRNMADYDVVIIPSTYDGWNLNANYAIQAGIGCIITDQAGSNDIIINKENGLVVKSDSSQSILDAMITVLNSPSMLEKWTINNKVFAEYITPEVVSEYLISILDYTFLKRGMKPSCPWLNWRK